MGRSILAVVVGWLIWGVASNLAFAIGGAASPESFGKQGQPVTTGALTVFAALAFVWSVGSGAVCSRIDRGRSRTTLAALCVALVLTGAAVQALTWSLYPVWYHVVFLAVLVPGTLLGGRRCAKRP